MSNNTGMMNTILANSIAQEAQSHVNLAHVEANQANDRARAAESKLASVRTDGEWRHRCIIETDRANLAEVMVAKLQEELKQRDALLVEWMHSTEAFKRLTTNFGKKLGLTPEARKN